MVLFYAYGFQYQKSLGHGFTLFYTLRKFDVLMTVTIFHSKSYKFKCLWKYNCRATVITIWYCTFIIHLIIKL